MACYGQKKVYQLEINHENINDCTIVHFKGKTHSFSQEELIKTRIYDRGFGPYVEEYLND